ncbi:phytoene desaturase family protein [Rosistilla oblonga]|uniref:phytoene desaturase family protein n=1 Tax=Rosistilla oblonga TaxID=2527990 RepID=UPI003A9691B0
MKNEQTDRYDAIIIGSGLGGLATASLLAQMAGKRVLVLERHSKLGGFTHCFRRTHHEWDTGVHYVGEMQYGSQTRQVMDFVTGGGIQWNSLGDPFEHFVFPQETFDLPDNQPDILAALVKRFPDEQAALEQYFRDIQKMRDWMVRWYVGKTLPDWMASLLTMFRRRMATMNTGEYLAKQFRDPFLRAVIAAQWPDFGTPPSDSSFAFHGIVSGDFLNGGYFPAGGGTVLAEHTKEVIEAHGGACLINRSVKNILIENGKAIGVVAIHKEKEVTYRAPIVISNAGGVITFGKLCPEGHGIRERNRIARMTPGPSVNVLYLGLKEDPRKHGFDAGNYWLYARTDHNLEADPNNPEQVDGCYFGFGSLRNPGQEPHTAQIISFSEDRHWARWDNTKWKRRGEDYEQKKAATAEALLDHVELFFPRFRELIDYQELSTPLTVKTFTDHWHGTIYGSVCNQHRLYRDRWAVKTSVKNLYLTGSDVGIPGVNGALMSGVMTAGTLLAPLGLGVARIMMRAEREHKQRAKAEGNASPQVAPAVSTQSAKLPNSQEEEVNV